MVTTVTVTVLGVVPHPEMAVGPVGLGDIPSRWRGLTCLRRLHRRLPQRQNTQKCLADRSV